MRLKKIIVFLVLNFLFFGTNFLHGGDLLNLMNIGNKFIVAIGDLNEDAIKIGLTEKRLRTITELRLRREGITIVSEDMNGTLSNPHFYVDVHIIGAAVHFKVEIHEWVELKRLPILQKCPAITWSLGMTGTHSGDPEFIISGLNQIIDRFLNEYYQANPKKKQR